MSSPQAAQHKEPAPGPPPRFWARFIATGAFTGYLPWAPGTAGSLAGLLIALIPGAMDPAVLSVLIAAGLLAGAPAARAVAEHVGNRLTRTAAMAKERFQPGAHAGPDPSIVVIDEMVGMWVALLFLPPSVPAYACAFLAFRAFDILKPPPARQLEAVPRGWGIMLDDVVAGIYANILTQLLVRLLFPLFGW